MKAISPQILLKDNNEAPFAAKVARGEEEGKGRSAWESGWGSPFRLRLERSKELCFPEW